jgi:hypothetical protein
VRLRMGLRVLRRARDEVQIGTDARWAVRMAGLTAGEVDLLLTLDQGASTLGLLPLARGLQLAPGRLDDLLAALDRARLLAPERAGTEGTGSGPRDGGPDAAIWARLLPDGDGAALLAARRDRVVGLLGAGRVGLSAAVTLAAAGVGAVLVDDDRPVTAGDLGVGGYTARDLGTARRGAAARILRDLAPGVRTTAPARTRPDVLVLVEHGATDAVRARVLMSEGVVHLSVLVRDGDVVVGPLVRPGSSACLRCLDLYRADADEHWPAVAAQLVATGRTRPPEEETVLAAVAGALAAGQVLAQLDGTFPRTLGAALEIALPEAVPRLRVWSVHPRCGCTGPRASSGP